MNKLVDFTRPFGLYIHVPFCVHKCNYCDFYSEAFNQGRIKYFLQALQRELELYAELLSAKEISTIYIGGGTPSLLKPSQLEGLLELIFNSFSFTGSREITLECNPSSLKKEKIAAFKKAGINRLSLGVQSFNERELKFLGRLHTPTQAIKVLEEVKKYFTNYNLDLIFALPGQSLEEWEESLKKAVSFKPPHLSLYNLQIEEGTVLDALLKEGKIKEVDDRLDAEMYLLARKVLQEKGYRQYEISNFARPGYESKHNLIYWQYQPYLGLGPAAHSFDGKVRFSNYSDLEIYCQRLSRNQLPVAGVTPLSRREQMSEMLFMGLRLIDGVSTGDFKARFGLELKEVYQDELNRLTGLGLVQFDEEQLKLTQKGILLGNEVFMEFLP
ncbi:MAG: hypothetical protein PWR10_1385 [Halanaerobiales bacterium]|nr:hypothetical protein [Halanaerobiales bacterium]